MSIGQRIMLRVVSALIALALVAGACLLIGQVVVGLTGGGNFLVPTTDWYGSLRSTTWGDSSVVYVGLTLLIAGGLVLLVSVLARPRLFTLADPQHGVDVVIPPRAVAQMLRRQAEAVPGVGSASAEVSRDLARISVTVPLAPPDKVEQELAESIAHGLKQVPWTRVPRLEIDVIGARENPAAPHEQQPAPEQHRSYEQDPAHQQDPGHGLDPTHGQDPTHEQASKDLAEGSR